MIHIQEDHFVIMQADEIPYTRVEVSGPLTLEQIQERLDGQKLFDLIAAHQVTNLLLNTSQLWRFGTGELQWLSEVWAQKAKAAGIQKVAVVVASQVFALFTFLFDAAAEKVNDGAIEMRFFNDTQFYDGWESVAWFNAQ